MKLYRSVRTAPSSSVGRRRRPAPRRQISECCLFSLLKRFFQVQASPNSLQWLALCLAGLWVARRSDIIYLSNNRTKLAWVCHGEVFSREEMHLFAHISSPFTVCLHLPASCFKAAFGCLWTLVTRCPVWVFFRPLPSALCVAFCRPCSPPSSGRPLRTCGALVRRKQASREKQSRSELFETDSTHLAYLKYITYVA